MLGRCLSGMLGTVAKRSTETSRCIQAHIPGVFLGLIFGKASKAWQEDTEESLLSCGDPLDSRAVTRPKRSLPPAGSHVTSPKLTQVTPRHQLPLTGGLGKQDVHELPTEGRPAPACGAKVSALVRPRPPPEDAPQQEKPGPLRAAGSEVELTCRRNEQGKAFLNLTAGEGEQHHLGLCASVHHKQDWNPAATRIWPFGEGRGGPRFLRGPSLNSR
ncbi:hypothetical protein GN956_G19273 [Arapaima gigas]